MDKDDDDEPKWVAPPPLKDALSGEVTIIAWGDNIPMQELKLDPNGTHTLSFRKKEKKDG